MYAFHSARHDALYTDWVMYCPEVPVFRDDDGEVLVSPFRCAFVTAPAPNVRGMGDRALAPERQLEIRRALETRIDRVLAVAFLHGHDKLVLGAWGCGAFGNDPELVAGLFHHALTVEWAGAFSEVVFAIYGDRHKSNHAAFRARFG